MKKIKIIVVDDEEEAREGIKQLLAEDSEIELLSVCKNGLEAINEINRSTPDLVFLDIQMPEINGFDVLNSIKIKPLPMIIFITAFDQYALRAFEIHANDYLLKPFTDERFYQALEFAKNQIRNASIDNINRKLTSILTNYVNNNSEKDSDRLINENSGLNRMIIKSSGKIYFIQLDDISWVEAFDYYVKIHVKDKFYLVRESLKKMESKLPGDKFIRIHKSTIINMDYVRELEPHFNGEFIVKLNNEKQLKVSRSFRKNLDGILKH
jgi:two-component system, LytTR family, response regulator